MQFDYGKKGYFYTEPDFQLAGPRISEGELLALLISKKLISEASGGLLGEELGRVSGKLGSLLNISLPGRASPEEAFSFRLRNTSPSDPQVFKAVTEALIQGRLLRFTYRSASSDEEFSRTVEPHHMVNYMGNWHLIAFCRLRGDWRDFLTARITDCRVEEQSFAIRSPEEWQPFLQDTFGIYQNREKFEVVLRFTSERSRWVRKEVWHKGQREELDDDGNLTRTIPVSHDAEIMMEILKHGAQVEVLAPEWLREKVAKELKAAARRYGKKRITAASAITP